MRWPWSRRPPGRHERPAYAAPAVSAVTPGALPPAMPCVAPPLGPNVELGFRDGSTAALDPTSPEARALGEMAGALTRLP